MADAIKGRNIAKKITDKTYFIISGRIVGCVVKYRESYSDTKRPAKSSTACYCIYNHHLVACCGMECEMMLQMQNQG